eukprot:gnl/MRDRNA2_/MRDRNA2_177731_c0_seq1.p1 gnl/MRDRNA2_/MRDRNA2_177731_c0~~gnl/MRDRNA2_/MRDRNA2_177731_c0_seq1.p1  ORF type:complete len:305 (+),score=62.71 gnl/MRDRNA2_/MRDRNA2_177731_c0_seq1:110-1024(+)
MGNNCCTDRSDSKGEPGGRSTSTGKSNSWMLSSKLVAVDALFNKTKDQLADDNSEYSQLKANRNLMEKQWVEKKAKEDHAPFEVGEVVSVDMGGRSRDGEVQEVKEGACTVKWIGANPVYAPPEDISVERLTHTAPPASWAETMYDTERANIFLPEMLAIWDEYVGSDVVLNWKAHETLVEDYCGRLKKHIYEIWVAEGAMNDRVPAKYLEDAKPKIQKALLEKTDDVVRQSDRWATQIWKSMPKTKTEGITKEVFLEKYYLRLTAAIPLTRICARAIIKAMAESTIREIKALQLHLRRSQYGW